MSVWKGRKTYKNNDDEMAPCDGRGMNDAAAFKNSELRSKEKDAVDLCHSISHINEKASRNGWCKLSPPVNL